MKKNYRKGRLAGEIKKIISEMLMRDLKDPRLMGLISVTDVEATADGNFATVYVSIFGDAGNDSANDEEKQDVIDALKNAKGLIRHEIGSRLELRHTPDLGFKIDSSEEYGRHIEQIIDSLKKDDE